MLQFIPLAPEFVAHIRAGGPDANGQIAERAVSDGQGKPCRSCLRQVPEGATFLILALRPFPDLQPYAETGPIFLCADDCTPWAGGGVPPILTTSPRYLIKAYTADNRIRYGTGALVEPQVLMAQVTARLEDPALAFVDVRSATNNCFLTRAIRDGGKSPAIR